MCGSKVSNQRGENRAAIDGVYKGNDTSRDYIYPFNEKCYATYGSGIRRTDPMPDKDGTLNFTLSDRFLSSATGFVNYYDGSGY